MRWKSGYSEGIVAWIRSFSRWQALIAARMVNSVSPPPRARELVSGNSSATESRDAKHPPLFCVILSASKNLQFVCAANVSELEMLHFVQDDRRCGASGGTTFADTAPGTHIPHLAETAQPPRAGAPLVPAKPAADTPAPADRRSRSPASAKADRSQGHLRTLHG